MVLSQTDRTLSLRLAKTPKGPTLQFKIKAFSLTKDVRALQAKKFGSPQDFLDAPLVVLQNLNGKEPHMQLMTKSFQNMFPSINVNLIRWSQCTRVVLFHRDPETEIISLRHYRIVVNPLGISKSIKRVAQNKVPSMSQFNDISEYVLAQAKASESDVEDDEDAHIDIEQKVKGKLNEKLAQSSDKNKGAIRLVELGPRIEMTLAKIQTGFMEGEVMWHWQGLDYARLKEQRKKEVTKKTSEFPGARMVMEAERKEREKLRQLEEEREKEEERKRQEKLERKKRRKEKK